MSKLKNDYRIAPSAFAKMKPEDRTWGVLKECEDPYVGRICGRLQPLLKRMTPGQRAFLAIHYLEAEVLNGGIHQYFWNSTGNTYHEALAGLELIGAHDHLGLLRKMEGLFSSPEVINSFARRRRAMDKISRAKTRELFDDPFYTLEKRKKSQLRTFLLAYLKKQPADFVLPAEPEQAKKPTKQRDYRVSNKIGAKLRGEKLHWKLIEKAWDDYWDAIRGGNEALTAFLPALTRGQRALVVVDILNKEILHLGGFEGFFTKQSSSRIMADEAMAGLELLEAKPYVELFRKALDLADELINTEESLARLAIPLREAKAAGNEAEYKAALEPRNAARRRRMEISDQLDEPLSSMGEAFQNLLSSKSNNIEKFIEAYVDAHPGEFFRQAPSP